eukprot:NODE_528_length_7173_cov_0.249929.p6 type:complete len:104 gc:universal NODE_528_length_7173_cov_0.249929:2578-2889(+)
MMANKYKHLTWPYSRCCFINSSCNCRSGAFSINNPRSAIQINVLQLHVREFNLNINLHVIYSRLKSAQKIRRKFIRKLNRSRQLHRVPMRIDDIIIYFSKQQS